MTSAYLMTRHAFAEKNCVEGFDSSALTEAWDFLAVEGGMKGVGPQYKYVKRLLSVSGILAFKVWKLKRWLHNTAVAATVLLLALLVALIPLAAWAAVTNRDKALSDAVTVGLISVVIAAAALCAVALVVLIKTRRGEALVRVALGFGSVLTSFAAWLHLHFFDPMYLREGSGENYKKRFPAAARADEPRRSEVTPAQEPVPAPTQAAPAAAEVVGAGVDILSHAPAEVSGNGHTADPDAFAERIDIKDSEERQD
jgi:hypothetical protein